MIDVREVAPEARWRARNARAHMRASDRRGLTQRPPRAVVPVDRSQRGARRCPRAKGGAALDSHSTSPRP